MSKFKVICTHNPQEFFNGSEPAELARIHEADTLDDLVQAEIKGGYQVIVTMPEGGE